MSGHQHGAEAVAAAIDGYTPTPARLDAAGWAQVAELARAAVRRCEHVSVHTARGYMGHAAGLLAWALTRDDVELTDEAVFCDATIARYVAATDYADSTRKGIAAALGQMVPDERRPGRDRIAVYTPTSVPAEMWTQIAPLVRDAVRRCLPLRDGTVGTYLSYAARYVAWAHAQGVTLDARVVFTDERIGTYATEQLADLGDNYRAAICSGLRQMTFGTDPVDLDVTDPVRIADAIDRYTPRKLDPAVWDPVAELTRQAVRHVDPPSKDAALQLLRFTAAFLAWCDAQPSIPLKPAAVFTDRTITRYVANGLQASTGDAKATIRSQLRLVARAHPDNAMAPPAETLRDSDGSMPYSDAEEAAYFQAARTQSTALRRRKLTAICCLGFGAGLAAHDMRWVTGEHVRRDKSGTVLVDVVGGDRPRTVVVTDRYADRLLQAATDAGGQLVCGGRKAGRDNALSDILAWLEQGSDQPRLSATRMRNTWVARQLAAGVPLNLVLRQAGLTSTRSIEHLVWTLPAGTTDVRARLLADPTPRLAAGDEQDDADWQVAS